jgi:hypothetical protein
MSLSFNKKAGGAICVIKGGKYDKDKVYLSDKEADDAEAYSKSFSTVKLTDGLFQPIPNKHKERDIGMIVGASGSGKSTFVAKYCAEYKKMYPSRPIYMFSNLTEDKSLDGIDIKRIVIGENLLRDPLTVEDFTESLVLFDDMDVVREKTIREACYQILNEILETGRHFKTSCIITNHLATGPHLKRILNEAHWFVYFPSGATRSTKYVLENYIGVDKKDVAKIKACKSRWAFCLKNFPQCVITEKVAFMLCDDS